MLVATAFTNKYAPSIFWQYFGLTDQCGSVCVWKKLTYLKMKMLNTNTFRIKNQRKDFSCTGARNNLVLAKLDFIIFLWQGIRIDFTKHFCKTAKSTCRNCWWIKLATKHQSWFNLSFYVKYIQYFLKTRKWYVHKSVRYVKIMDRKNLHIYLISVCFSWVE